MIASFEEIPKFPSLYSYLLHLLWWPLCLDSSFHWLDSPRTETIPPPSSSTAQQLRLARAWRDRLRADSATSGGHLTVARRCDHVAAPIPLDAPHCADLFVKTAGPGDATRVVARLGELLRLVHLATALHVDSLILNALWDDDALCAMGPALCARCDDVDLGRVAPTVTLSIARGLLDVFQTSWRSGVGVIHDALYAWREETASTEFRQLRDALGASGTDHPPVQLNLVLGLFEDDGEMMVRDLQALVARAEAGPFRVARVIPLMRAAQAKSPHFARLHTTILDLGIGTRPAPMIHDRATPEQVQHAWQWLIDWAERADKPPQVEVLTIVRRPGQTTELLTELLRRVVMKNTALRRLTVFWPLHLETDADERRLAAEAIGAALLASYEGVRLDKLELDLGDLSADDVTALQRGAQGCSSGDDASGLPRFQSVKWKAPRASEESIEQVVCLLGNVGVCELEIDVGGRDLSCRTLKNVMQDCAATLTALSWWGLDCDDAIELENTTPWTNFPSELRGLRVCVRDGGDLNAVRALDALLARIGLRLTTLVVIPFQGALTDHAAELIVARCPELITLHVASASPQFYEQLTQAYDDGQCGIRRLSVQAFPRAVDTGWPALLGALQDPTHGATRTLRELTLSTTWTEDHTSDEVFNALIATLSTNTTLTRVVLGGRFGADAKTRLHALAHRFAVRVPSRRRRLALISVSNGQENDSDTRLPKLPLDVLQVVFAFAGRRTPRYKYQF